MRFNKHVFELIVLVFALSQLGAACHIGQTFSATDTEPAKTTGWSGAIGQASVGPVEGGAFSIPFVSGGWCAIRSAVAYFYGEDAPECRTIVPNSDPTPEPTSADWSLLD